jgi:hypothetical protein
VLDVDAAAVRAMTGLLLPAVSLPLEKITVRALVICAAVVAGLVVILWFAVVVSKPRRKRPAARHGLRSDGQQLVPGQNPWTDR